MRWGRGGIGNCAAVFFGRFAVGLGLILLLIPILILMLFVIGLIIAVLSGYGGSFGEEASLVVIPVDEIPRFSSDYEKR